MKICKVKDCGKSASYLNNGSGGYCSRHRNQMYRNGKIYTRTRYDKNKIIDFGNYYGIELYNGMGEQKKVAIAKIDKDDINKIKNKKWTLMLNGYVCWQKENILLHRLITGVVGDIKMFQVDHVNHDPLDNRKNNLRICTSQENSRNIKCKGYSLFKRTGKWKARIMIDRKEIHLGYYDKEEDAKNAREKAVRKHFKEFAFKNNN